MAEPPADLLAIQSSLDQLLVLVQVRADRTATHSTDKAPLTDAAWYLSSALWALDRLIAAYRKED